MEADALLDNEAQVYKGKLHWSILMVPAAVCFFAIGAVAGLLIIKHAVFAGLIFLAALLWTLPALVRYRTNGLILTNKRVIARTGVVSRRSIDIALTKIEGVSFEQNLAGQLFNFGTILIRGTGGGIEQFPMLAAPAEFSRQVHQQIANNTVVMPR